MRNVIIALLVLIFVCATCNAQVSFPDDSMSKNYNKRPYQILLANQYMKRQIADSTKFRKWIDLSYQPLQYYLMGDNTLVDSLLQIAYPKQANYNKTWDSVLQVILK